MASDASQSAPPKISDLKRAHAETKRQPSYESTLPPLKARKRNGQTKQVSAVQLCNYMWTCPTAESTALFFDVGIQPLYRYIKKHWGITYDEFRERNLSHTRNALVQKCIAMALEQDNVQALRLALKNIAGWSDSVEIAPGTTSAPIQLRYSLDAPPAHPPPRDVTPESA